MKGIQTITHAQEFVGLEAWVNEADLQPLEEDLFYCHQLIGLTVEIQGGDRIGVVKDVLSIQNNELLIVEKQGKEVLIPFIQSICLEVDLGRKRIIIDPPEGLLEVNEI